MLIPINMKLLTLGLCLAISLSLVTALSYRSESDVTDLMLKYVKNTQTSTEAAEFKRMVQLLSFPNYVRNERPKYGTGRATLLCLTCRTMVNTILNLYESGAALEEMVNVAVNLCRTLDIQPENVCRGVIELNADVVLYIIQHRKDVFTSRSFCGIVMQTDDPDDCPYDDERYEWEVEIPAKKESTARKPTSKDEGTIKIAHISDAHYDPAYEAGGLANCDEATCCRRGQENKRSQNWRALFEEKSTDNHVYVDNKGDIYFDIDYAEELQSRKDMHKNREPKIEEEDQAGYWGDYRSCDTPWWTFEASVDFIAENHQDLEYVYYTGDTIDHGVWETTYEMITDSLNDTYGKFREAFGSTPVIPGIGNHESQPLNQYAPPEVTEPEVSTQWLYKLLSDIWSGWIPAETRETIMIGGYYTFVPRPGFRIIVLNSNLCYVNNWWIHYEPNDPSGQYAWLVGVLFEAENAGEMVHILSHIPTGRGSVYSVCSREYARILERFSDIIAAEFNGHSHKDELKVYYKKESGEPYNVAWNGGALTAYSNVNLNYRVYEVETENYGIMDAETWMFDLDEANLTPEQRPRWYRAYSFREHYGVESLSPENIDELITRMVTTDKQLIQDYHRFRGGSAPNWVNGCGDNCIKSNLCSMVTTYPFDQERCQNLWEIYASTEEKRH